MNVTEKALTVFEYCDDRQRREFLNALLEEIDSEKLARLLDRQPIVVMADGTVVEYVLAPMCDGQMPTEWLGPGELATASLP